MATKQKGNKKRRQGKPTCKAKHKTAKLEKSDREEATMTMKRWLLSSLLASTCLIPLTASAGPIENYSPVTADRLKNPEPGNWMLYRRTYDGQGYSPLNQINTSNVKDLVPVWTFSTGVVEGHEAPPIVNNGVMGSGLW
jgi:alcohol dehydrogenase (cytochrome c)